MSVSGGWTNYGPLTSIFTPPPACTYLTMTAVTITTYSNTLPYVWYTTTVPHLDIYDPLEARSCFPTQLPTPKTPQTISVITKTSEDWTTKETIYPTFTQGYFSPGRCPEGWATKTLDYSFTPTNHTLAACCPTFPTQVPDDPHLEKRRGRNGSGQGRRINTACDFTIPTISPTTGGAHYPAITALSNGTLTTMAAEDWFSIAGTEIGARVYATGVNVMWATGDFPDIDAAASVASVSASASASASNAAFTGQDDHSSGGMSTFTKIGIGAGIPLALIFVGTFFFAIRRQCMHKRGDGMTALFFRALKGAIMNPQDGLLTTEGKGSGSTAGVGTSRRDDIESFPILPPVKQMPITQVDDSPPAYTQTGESSTASDSRRWNETALEFELRKVRERKELLAAGPSAASELRASNETDLEYEQRRLRERKEMLLEKIRIAREEDDLRARIKARGP